MPAARMSSRLEDTSAVLGEYMLKGWTLTDLHCDQCRVTPLMREPAASASAENRERVQFCALCDGSPAGRTSAPPAPARVSQPSSSATPRAGQTSEAGQADPSESISTLLLQGYSLLGDNCTNPSCRGIPLVGYPRKKDGTKDGRKMCVACGGRWIDGNDLSGMTLLSSDSAAGSASRTAIEGGESPRSRARREMYGLVPEGLGSKGKQAEVVRAADARVEVDDNEDEDFDLEDAVPSHTSEPVAGFTSSSAPTSRHAALPASASGLESDSTADPVLVAALQKTSGSLARTLDRIATSLDRHTESDRDQGRYFVDVKLHTEAIKDVMMVMGLVKRYRP